MENILPSSAYWRAMKLPARLFLILGLVVGGAVQALRYLSPSLIASGEVRGEPLPAILWGMAAGFALGILMWWLFQLQQRILTWRAYHEHGFFAAPPPESEENLTHRLPANLDGPNWIYKVAGILYAGPGTLVFVPQAGNLPKNLMLRRIPVDAETTFTPSRRPPSGWARSLGADSLPILEIRTRGNLWTLFVPEPDTVAASLSQIVRGIR